MKVLVCSYSGTVGKTTFVANLLASRIPRAMVFAIETVNETAASMGIEVTKISGAQYYAYYRMIITVENAIVDLGASNVDAFMAGMVRYDGSQGEFDYIIIPVLSGTKEQKEAMALVNLLTSMDVDPERIRIVFNRVKSDVADEFQLFLNYAKKEKRCWVDERAAVYENELYDMLMVRHISITDVLLDKTDYRKLARLHPIGGDEKILNTYTSMHLMQALAKGVSVNLDKVFNILIPEVA